ncbi:MAG: 2-C-methyl-D-erythritol 4-phosphate cytidylyltransferase [Bacillota bacterium]|nr:2-C-methyl-D-erythritol 4-phosphate cytidylyltransferase [Bacillota bacterium]MDK2856272.1 2-C-methyl-D-erythritol 4-phosphate cytidylyltransferase [Bacillota bacterium]MDK2924996.1 2-C-methyl-D-erythritol 4-phosphate cytidylyltransferase [Bacillota bacterium]
MKVYALIPAAGSGRRMGSETKKQFLLLGGRPLFLHCLEVFAHHPEVTGIVLVVSPGDEERAARLVAEYGLDKKVEKIIPGGAERQDSVRLGLAALPQDTDFVLIHDAARPFLTPDLIERTLAAARRTGAAVAAVPVKDTIKVAGPNRLVERTLKRSTLWAIGTPQTFAYGLILEAHRRAHEDRFIGTDDAVLVERLGRPVELVPASDTNIKITTPTDLLLAECLFGRGAGDSKEAGPAGEKKRKEEGSCMMRVGTGFDVHAFKPGRRLVLGGVEIPYPRGLGGHSDADVLLHAIADALLGAAGERDIGHHFPDQDPAWAGVSSLIILEKTAAIIRRHGFSIANIDSLVIAQEPKIAPYVEKMRANIAQALQIPLERVAVKATSTERLGFTGRGEGIAAQAVCLLQGVSTR